MISPLFKKNDRLAKILIIVFSIVVFAVISGLGSLKEPLVEVTAFDANNFALLNAILNSAVAVLLVVALVLVRQRKYGMHRNVMMVAMVLSILFLVSYITHKLLKPEARFGDVDHDGVVSAVEAARVGSMRYLYLAILITHISLAGLILPFILFTAYRGLTGEYARHKKIARWTWPLWLYVSVTGPVVYFFISPYYH